jgi:hypothetical protein
VRAVNDEQEMEDEMKLSDIWLLTKKIAVGAAVTLIPLIIIAGGLWMTQHVAGHPARAKQTSTKEVSYAN